MLSQLFRQPHALADRRRDPRRARPRPRHAALRVPAARRGADVLAHWRLERTRAQRRAVADAAGPAAPVAADNAGGQLGRPGAGRRARPRGGLSPDPAGRQGPGRRAAAPHQGDPPQVRAGHRLPAAGGAHPRQPRADAERLSHHAEGRRRSAEGEAAPACSSRSTRAAPAARSAAARDHAIRRSACRRTGSATERERAQAQGYTVVDAGTVVATHLSTVVNAQAAALLGRQRGAGPARSGRQGRAASSSRRSCRSCCRCPPCSRCCRTCSTRACTSATCARSSRRWPITRRARRTRTS